MFDDHFPDVGENQDLILFFSVGGHAMVMNVFFSDTEN